VQPSPDGLAQAFVIGPRLRRARRGDARARDNIFYGHDLHVQLERANAQERGATVFA